jgi:integrase
MRKPFYFSQKKCWYVRDERGRAIRLDPDESEAYRIWNRLVESQSDLSHPAVTFRALVCTWMEEHELQMSATEFTTVCSRLVAFADWLTDQGPATAQARNLKPHLILTWLQSQNWKGWTERAAIANIKRVMKWAHSEGHIKKNPIAEMKLKEPRYRTRVLSQEEHSLLVYSTRKRPGGKQFALLLIAAHCGARPQQIRDVTPANVHQSGTAWVFHDHKTAEKTGKPMVVYLHPCLQTITKILAARKKADEPLFIQSDGQPWSKDTVSRRFARMRDRIGFGQDVVLYCYRHTFATAALNAEIPIATVSTLLGHVDTRMVSKVYGHLDQVQQHLLDAAAKTNAKRLRGDED